MSTFKATLTRFKSTEQGTPGVFTLGSFRAFSMELPWKDNASNVSCIPTGTYTCQLTYSPRFKRPLYLVSGVKDRAGVRIHPANLAKQLNGCIALGLKKGRMNGEKAIFLSQSAVRQLETILKGMPFTLEIKDYDY